eukprot:1751000-Pyramimonas_sp.AAC.1
MWVKQRRGSWWYPVCPARWAAAESTISPRVREHYSGQNKWKPRTAVEDRLAMAAELGLSFCVWG